MRTKISITVLMALLLFLSASCATRYENVRHFFRPKFDHTFIKKIAVIEFSNYSNRRNAGRIVSDQIELHLVNKSGYEVISRMQLRDILHEHNLSSRGVLSPSTAKRIGKLAGVDALLVGNVEKYDLNKRSWKERAPGSTYYMHKKEALVVFTFKVLNTTTGQVVFAKNARGTWWRKASDQNMDYIERESDYEYMQIAVKRALESVSYIYPHYFYTRRKVK